MMIRIGTVAQLSKVLNVSSGKKEGIADHIFGCEIPGTPPVALAPKQSEHYFHA